MNGLPQIPFLELVKSSASLRCELKMVYDRLPATRCLRQVRCCLLLPEMTFLETLPAISAMRSWPPLDRINIMRKMVRYFLGNATEIHSCPFLQGSDCLIYPDRFFGCRAYGLWSKDYYQELVKENRQGKLFLRQQWENLGIPLPDGSPFFRGPLLFPSGNGSAAGDHRWGAFRRLGQDRKTVARSGTLGSGIQGKLFFRLELFPDQPAIRVSRSRSPEIFYHQRYYPKRGSKSLGSNPQTSGRSTYRRIAKPLTGSFKIE